MESRERDGGSGVDAVAGTGPEWMMAWQAPPRAPESLPVRTVHAERISSVARSRTGKVSALYDGLTAATGRFHEVDRLTSPDTSKRS